MLTTEVTLNIIVLGVAMLVAALFGFLVRTRQIMKCREKVEALEREMLAMDAEMLDVQREYCRMEAQLKDFKIPVIPLKSILREKDDEKIPDISLRKKLLSRENLLQQQIASK